MLKKKIQSLEDFQESMMDVFLSYRDLQQDVARISQEIKNLRDDSSREEKIVHDKICDHSLMEREIQDIKNEIDQVSYIAKDLKFLKLKFEKVESNIDDEYLLIKTMQDKLED